MPYCPDCRDEFEDWVEVCPDCGVPLVASRPPEPPKPPKAPMLYSNEPLLHVATAPNEAIAAFWAGILENNGIQCLLKGPDMRSAMYVIAVKQACTVHVLKSSALRAKRLLVPLEKELKEYIRERGNLPVSTRIYTALMGLIYLI